MRGEITGLEFYCRQPILLRFLTKVSKINYDCDNKLANIHSIAPGYSDMKNKSVSGITIHVKNLNKTAKFYEALGFDMKKWTISINARLAMD
jgi:catechol-2,3-dioxygenase